MSGNAEAHGSRHVCTRIILFLRTSSAELVQRGAGLWEPYQIAGTSDADIARWGGATFGHFLQIYRSAAAVDAGLSYLPCIAMYSKEVRHTML